MIKNKDRIVALQKQLKIARDALLTDGRGGLTRRGEGSQCAFAECDRR
jgi:hypothetical protein